jgi:RHS repeat-associated protein
LISTGKERDSESGNDYFEARYYGSSMGRFLSPDDGDGGDNDPSNPQSWNLYSYVQNNPLTSTDPDGHDCVTQTRTSATTETVSVSSGTCSGSVGDGQSQTYVPGTVTGISVNGGNSLDIGYNSYDGQSSGVTNAASAPYPDSPNTDPHWGNNPQGLATLGAAGKVVNYAAIGAAAMYTGAIFAPEIAAGGSAALAAGRGLYYAAMGLLPAVPSALEKLQKLDISVSEANEIIESPTTQRLVDNANSGNVNYIADVGGKLIRITTDPNGQRIISAGMVRANQIANGIASGRFTK